MKIKVLKLIDGSIGRAFVRFIPIFPENTLNRIEKILIIRPGGIGDAVLLLPAIQALREKFGDSRIDVLCEKRNGKIFGLSGGIDNVYLYDRGLDLFRCLKNRYDVVIDTEQWHRLSAVIAYLTGAAMRIGFATNERERLFTHKVAYSHKEYEVYSFLRLIEPPAGHVPGFKTEVPFITAPDELLSVRLRTDMGKDKKVIAVFPGASVVERRWGGDRFGKVAQAFQDKGYRIVILGSRADGEAAEVIKRHAPGCVDLTGKTGLAEVAAVLRHSRVLLSADSGLMHIAYAVGTPTVSLFGAGIEEKWAPRGKRHMVLSKHVPCSPCTKFGYTPSCTRNMACLQSLEADEVIEAVGKTLGWE